MQRAHELRLFPKAMEIFFYSLQQNLVGATRTIILRVSKGPTVSEKMETFLPQGLSFAISAVQH
jgi:hypothetical protein